MRMVDRTEETDRGSERDTKTHMDKDRDRERGGGKRGGKK